MEEINEKKTHKWKTIKRLLKYVAPYRNNINAFTYYEL